MLQESLKQPQPRELTPDETMEILTRNYTEKDPEALKLLCLEYDSGVHWAKNEILCQKN